jgi:hypothetical protein
LLISKLQAVIGAAILIVATAAVSAIVVSKWNPFPPKDYEDCASRAAKDAKSKDALSVLLSICASEFQGRRKPGGGYTYFDSCQQRTVDIKSPNPTSTELSAIEQQCLTYIEAQEQIEADQKRLEAEQKRRAAEAAEQRRREQQQAQDARNRQLQAAQEARAAAAQQRQVSKLSAMNNVQAKAAGFECSLFSCNLVDMSVEVTNASKEALSSVWVGVAFVPTNSGCPSSYADKQHLYLKLSPGETRADKIEGIDAALSKRRVCIKVVDVQLADEP